MCLIFLGLENMPLRKESKKYRFPSLIFEIVVMLLVLLPVLTALAEEVKSTPLTLSETVKIALENAKAKYLLGMSLEERMRVFSDDESEPVTQN